MIYLDSAATSLYKPETVQSAVISALQSMASPGRGSHAAAMHAAECCYACREALASLFHVPDPEQVVFTFNATHGLNIAIRYLVSRGTRVVVSGYEHNSVVRPLFAAGAQVARIDTPLFSTERFLSRARELLAEADVAVCTHVSNVFGYILPIEALAALCRERGIPLVIDASQSAGILPLDFSALGAAFVAMPGHKGLMGPQGTGVLLCNFDAFPLLYGGSGSQSALPTMPDYLPDRLEAGTQNVTGIAGLLASVNYLLSRGVPSIRAREQMLLRRLAAEIDAPERLTQFLSADPELQAGVLSVLPKRIGCDAFAEALGSRGVAVRAGLHCAPFAHQTVGTFETGTVRFSFSPFNTVAEIDRAAEIVNTILKNT